MLCWEEVPFIVWRLKNGGFILATGLSSFMVVWTTFFFVFPFFTIYLTPYRYFLRVVASSVLHFLEATCFDYEVPIID